MKANMKGICIRVVATLLTAVLVMSLCPVIPSARAEEETYTLTFEVEDLDTKSIYPPAGKSYLFPSTSVVSMTNYMKVAKGETAQLPSVRWSGEGKVLVCWEDENGNQYQPGDVIRPEKDMKITGVAKEKKLLGAVLLYYTVIIDPGTESGTSGTKYIITKDVNAALTLPDCPEKFSRDGYTFGGWKVQGSDPEKTFKAGDTILSGTSKEYDGKTFLAIWEGAPVEPEYKISYHYNPPAGLSKPESVANDPYTTSSKNIYDVNEQEVGAYHCSYVPLVGYEPLGWSADPEATEPVPQYAPGKTVTLTGNLDLYVVWKKTNYSCGLNCQYYNEGETLAGSGTKTVDLPAHMQYGDILTYEPELKDGTYGDHHYTLTEVVTSDTVEKGATNSITLRYEYDELNEANNLQTGGDKIPDKYQRLVTYKIQNGKWTDGATDDKTEVVTLKDGDDYSKTGTAALNKVPGGERAGAQYSETGIWSTGNGREPETVGSPDAMTFTLTFLEADKAIIIKPSRNTKVTYDGKQHTFDTFEAWDINGNKLDNVVVTIKSSLPKGLCGISAGQTVDIQSWLSENGKTWNDFFTVKVDGVEISLSENAVIFQTGEVGIAPKPLDITITLPKDTDANASYEYEGGELTVRYCYDADQHTVELTDEMLALDATDLVAADEGKKFVLSEADGSPLSLTAAYVVMKDGEVSDVGTIGLTPECLRLTGIGSENYTIGNVTVDASKIDVASRGAVTSLSLKITPRQVDYHTYGASKVFNGEIITRIGHYDATPYQNYYTAKEWPSFDLSEDLKTPEEKGFAVRHIAGDPDDLRRNQQPEEVRLPRQTDVDAGRCGTDCYLDGEVDAGIYEYMVLFDNYVDCFTNSDPARTPYTLYPDDIAGNQHFYDYAINYQNDYITIYPQSLDENAGKRYDAEAADGLTVYKYESTDVPDDEALESYYTGVYLVDEPERTYDYDGKEHKFTTELRNESNVNNTSNGIDYRHLEEDRDYTIKYERLDGSGNWVETEDFTNPGKLRVTFTGQGNYRDSIVREYEIVKTSEPGPGTGGGGPSVGTDDHDHYAYIIGKPGGIVDPDGKITRAEIATIIFRLLKEEVREEYWSKTNSFPDVEPQDWYNNAISTLQNLGIVEGRDDGLFHPDDPITRAEMAAMMSRLYDYDMDTGDIHTKFDDVKPDAWYARYVAAAEELGLFYGYPGDPNFYPNKNLTRAEAMTVYNRLLGRKPHRDGLLPESQMVLWPDNMDVNAWYYADVQEATNSHTCDLDGTPVGGERFERWLAPLPVRDWAALEREWSEAHSGYDGHDVN